MNNILQVSGNYALSISGEVWKMSKDNIPTKVMGYKDDNGNELSILKIAHGTNHLLALDTNGNVWALGANEHGQLGTNSRTASTVPVKVYKGEQNSGDSYLSGIVDISASKFVSAAIDVNGDIYRWGANEYGQLGIGNTTEKYVPAKVIKSSDDLKFDLVAGGSNHQMAVDENGNVWIVGSNEYGQLGDGTQIDKNVPLMVGGNEVVIYENGTALYGTIYMNVDDVKDLDAGFNVFNLYQSGILSMNEFEFVSSDLGVLEINKSTGVATANKAGTAYISAAENKYSQKSAYIKVIVSNNNVGFEPKAITKGNHSLALRADGTLWAWGINKNGQLGTGNTISVDEPTD